MALHIVLDGTGDSRHTFDPSNAEDAAQAKERFQQFIGKGYQAFDKNKGRRLNQHDPNVEETIFVPQLQGG